MAFADTIRALPFTGRVQQATGFLAPMVRAMGHILFLMGCVADADVTVNAGEAEAELDHAVEHWNARANTEAVSTASRDRATAIGTALTEARAEWPNWNDEQRVANLRDLAQRILQYCADLDRELVGIRESDPGTAL